MNGFVFQAEDGIRYLVRSRGLGDVDKRQPAAGAAVRASGKPAGAGRADQRPRHRVARTAGGLSLIHI